MIARIVTAVSGRRAGGLGEDRSRRCAEAAVHRPGGWLFQSVIMPPPFVRSTWGRRDRSCTNAAPSVLLGAFWTLYRFFSPTQGYLNTGCGRACRAKWWKKYSRRGRLLCRGHLASDPICLRVFVVAAVSFSPSSPVVPQSRRGGTASSSRGRAGNAAETRAPPTSTGGETPALPSPTLPRLTGAVPRASGPRSPQAGGKPARCRWYRTNTSSTRSRCPPNTAAPEPGFGRACRAKW